METSQLAADSSARRCSASKYTADEMKKWWPAVCPKCGWEGLSRDCDGGGAMADTGDYAEVVCPACFERGDWVPVDDAPNPSVHPSGGASPTVSGATRCSHLN